MFFCQRVILILFCSEMVVKQRWGIQVLYGTESYGMLGLSWRFSACSWMCSARMQKRGRGWRGYRLRIVTGCLRSDFSLFLIPHLHHVCAVTTLCKGRRPSWSTYNAPMPWLWIWHFFPQTPHDNHWQRANIRVPLHKPLYGAISKSRGSMQFCFSSVEGSYRFLLLLSAREGP